MRTVKSSGLPAIMMVIARSAAMNPRRKPPFLAWMTTPCALGAEVWTVKPSVFQVLLDVGLQGAQIRTLALEVLYPSRLP